MNTQILIALIVILFILVFYILYKIKNLMEDLLKHSINDLATDKYFNDILKLHNDILGEHEDTLYKIVTKLTNNNKDEE